MKQHDIWEYLFYGSMIVLTLWLILKLTGIIQTPVWLEHGIPIAGVILGVFPCYQHLLKTLMHLVVKVDRLESDVHVLKDDTRIVKGDVVLLKKHTRFS